MSTVNDISRTISNCISDLNKNTSNDFKFSEDGKSAVKFFKLTNENGIEKTYSFRIYFSSKSNSKDNLELLKNYTLKKVETLGKMSIELGLGQTYKGLSFSGAGEKGQLDLTRYDGSLEKINSNFSPSTSIEKAKAKLRMYKTMAFITCTSKKNPNPDLLTHKSTLKDTPNGKTIGLKEKELENVKQLQDQKALEIYQIKMQLIEYAIGILEKVKDYYIDDIKVSIYYEELFENIENKSVSDINEFIKANNEKRFKK